MRIAFYAPLKSPDHPVPSGDRQLARALLLALQSRGHAVLLASRLRTYDARGDAARQARLDALGARFADRLIARWRRAAARPGLWFTYHVYHKAPDPLGPRVATALGIPYVVAEASVAAKQRDGPWATGYAQALRSIDAAAGVVFVNPVDVDAVRARRPDVPCEVLLPFLDVAAFAAPALGRVRSPPRSAVRLISVGMMRDGAKLASYRVLADALRRLEALPWDIVLVGDGPARGEVEAAFAPLSPRVRFAGACSSQDVARLMHDADVYAWPAVDEAFGMTFLEAQACGLPVVAGDTNGVAAVVAHRRGGWLVAPRDAAAFAEALRRMIVDADWRERMGREARDNVREHHDLASAAERLDRFLARVCDAARADSV